MLSTSPQIMHTASKPRAELVRSIGFFSMILLVVGGVIGSGIFRKPGVMMNELGSPMLLLGVWVLAGAINYLGILSNAEVSGMIPETGGQYVYFERMYGPFVAFLYGWAAFVVIQTGSISALAYVFAEHAADGFIPLPHVSESLAAWSFHLPFVGDVRPFHEFGVKALASSVIIFLTVLNYLGAKFGTWTQNAFAIAKLAGMALLVVIVFLPGSGGSVQNITTPSATIHKEGIALVIAIVAAMQGAFWAFDGCVKATFVAGETHDPQRTIPRASWIGMLIVTAIYLIMSAAYCWVLPADVMAQSKLVAADAVEQAVPGARKWISLLVMTSTFGVTNAVILTSSRVYYSMALRSTFPASLGRVHPRFRTPSVALLVQGIWAVVLVFSGTFDMLTDTLVFVAWIFYALGAYGVIVLRKKEPNTPRTFKVPGYPIVPWLFVIFAAAFLIITVYNDVTAYTAAIKAGKPALINSAFGAVLVLIGTPIFFLCRKRQPREISDPPPG
jgi:basic amino acid/polyamine antiporter, APA family